MRIKLFQAFISSTQNSQILPGPQLTSPYKTEEKYYSTVKKIFEQNTKEKENNREIKRQA